MIVPSMTHAELMKEVKIDGLAVDRKGCFLADDLRRFAIKSKIKPIDRWYNYKSARKNDWIILIRHHGKSYNIYLFAWFIGKQGINIISASNNERSEFTFYHYTSHFISRYNERYLKSNLPSVDIFKHYFIRNMDLNAKTEGGRVCDYMGIVEDGVVFGGVEIYPYNTYVLYKTFISNEMILKFQENDIHLIEDFKAGKILSGIYV